MAGLQAAFAGGEVPFDKSGTLGMLRLDNPSEPIGDGWMLVGSDLSELDGPLPNLNSDHSRE